jgi:hypothetical protein
MKWTELRVLVSDEDKEELHKLIAKTLKDHGTLLSLHAVASAVIHASLHGPETGDTTNAVPT